MLLYINCLKECFRVNYENKIYIRLFLLKFGWRFFRGNKDLKLIFMLKNIVVILDNDGI